MWRVFGFFLSFCCYLDLLFFSVLSISDVISNLGMDRRSWAGAASLFVDTFRGSWLGLGSSYLACWWKHLS